MPDLRSATFWDKLMLAIGRRTPFVVEGDSMLPTLKSGQTIIADRGANISIGDIVLAAHPFKKSVKMIKRVESIKSDGRCVLAGDNPEASSDSRAFGSISRDDILGKVVCILSN